MARNCLPRLAICGHGRAGKDTASLWLEKHTQLRYYESTSQAAARLCYEALKDKYGYRSVQEAFDDRHYHRKEWARCIWEFNKPDGLSLYRLMIDTNDILNGIRRAGELQACADAGIIDLSIWIERDVPKDPSCELVAEDCDIVILNNGSFDDLYRRLQRLATALCVFVGEQKSR